MTAVWLYYVEDMPVAEIAQILSRTRMAVKTMLHRARKKLLPTLQEMNPNGSGKDRDQALEASSY